MNETFANEQLIFSWGHVESCIPRVEDTPKMESCNRNHQTRDDHCNAILFLFLTTLLFLGQLGVTSIRVHLGHRLVVTSIHVFFIHIDLG